MNNVYLGSDWHFSRWSKKENRLKYNIRKTKDILKKYKMIVKKDDIFIFLGDLSHIEDNNPTQIKYALSEIKYLPGKKIFIRGNNDLKSNEYYINELGFLVCLDELDFGDFIFTHIPIEILDNQINIHGHIHGARDYWDCDSKNHVDGFTEINRNFPIKLEPLLYREEFIDKSLINPDIINDLKNRLFKYTEGL